MLSVMVIYNQKGKGKSQTPERKKKMKKSYGVYVQNHENGYNWNLVRAFDNIGDAQDYSDILERVTGKHCYAIEIED